MGEQEFPSRTLTYRQENRRDDYQVLSASVFANMTIVITRFDRANKRHGDLSSTISAGGRQRAQLEAALKTRR
jgi:hypothetical protein